MSDYEKSWEAFIAWPTSWWVILACMWTVYGPWPDNVIGNGTGRADQFVSYFMHKCIYNGIKQSLIDELQG